MAQPSLPSEEQSIADAQPGQGHRRRPPLAEVDTWELWQEWQRGERSRVLPWIGLLVGFCIVLAGMYSFFFFSTSLDDDTIAQVGLTIVFIAIIFWIWRRISPHREFAGIVVALMLAVSILAFLLWLLAYSASGWNPFVAIAGNLALGLGGLLVGLVSLNAIGKQEGET